MGAISFSVDVRLLELFKRLLSATVFVETGTFEGESVRRAITVFERVYSVELSDQYFAKAKAEFADVRSVYLYHQLSPVFLRDLREPLRNDAVVYWLDAHWCVSDSAAGEKSQCPLLEELDAIGALNSRSVVLIDDARLFLASPPKPHNGADWPRFSGLLARLHALSDRHEMMVIDDVIAFYPAAICKGVEEYARNSALDLLAVMNASREHQTICPAMRADLEAKETVIRELAQELKTAQAGQTAKQNVIEELAQALEVVRADQTAKQNVIEELSKALEEARSREAAKAN